MADAADACTADVTDQRMKIAGFNVITVLCCLAVVAFGRLTRAARRDIEYTPSPYGPVGSDDSGRSPDKPSLKSAVGASNPVPKVKATNTKAATKRRVRAGEL